MLKKLILERFVLFVALFFMSAPLTFVHADAHLDRAFRIYSRLTGVGVNPSQLDLIQKLEKLSQKNNWKDIAALATQDPNFIDIMIRDFAAEMSNKPLNPVTPLNDFTALVMGATRDDRDARTILYGTFRYIGHNSEKLPLPSLDNNDHYLAIDQRRISPNKILVNENHPYGNYAAGVLTTRAWMEAHLSEGTNRRAAEYALQEFTCAPIMTYKDTDLGDGRVRPDINRAPNGKTEQYDKDCRGCHAPLDGFAGAFSRLDFVAGKPFFSKNAIALKYFNKLTDVDKEGKEVERIGYVTVDDSWVNQLQNKSAFGWEDPLENSGNGPQSLGKLLANSFAFSTCMTSKAFRKVCRVPLNGLGRAGVLVKAADNFHQHHSFRKLFAELASHELCTEGNSNVAFKNFRELFEFLVNRSEILPTDSVNETYKNEVSKLAKIGSADEFTAILQSSFLKLGSAFCKSLVDKQTAEENTTIRKMFEKLTKKFWNRLPTEEEAKLVETRIVNQSTANRWLSLCVATVTSPQTIAH